MRPDQRHDCGRLKPVEWLVYLGVCSLWVMAVSDRSFWLDEVHSAGWKAMQPTFSAWWHDLVTERTSDAQTPLYLLYIWAFGKLFGIGEWTLRAGSLPWLFVGFGLWQQAFGRRQPIRWGVAAAAGVSPFLWYYLDEARPYAMQAGSVMMMAAAAQLLYSGASRFWVGVLCFGAIALFGSNLLGGVWAGAALAAIFLVFGWQRVKGLIRSNWLVCAVTFVILSGLGGYYLWTLNSGARATAVGGTQSANVAYLLYELLGAGGIGAGRLAIRADGLKAFQSYLPGLMVYGLLLTPILFYGLRQLIRLFSLRNVLLVALPFAGALLFLLAVGVVSHFRVLGRHCTPLIIISLYWLAAGLAALWGNGKWGIKRVWVMAFLVLSLYSALLFRFADRHKKDDYRSAAKVALAQLQRGQRVWWNADLYGAAYYRVPVSTDDATGVRYLMNPAATDLTPPPDVIIASRPDVYDATGALADFIRGQGFKRSAEFTAFTIWTRKTD